MIKNAYKNILETSTVTLTAGTEDNNYPLYRLYDRNIGRVFKPTTAQTIEVLVDQGSEIFVDDFNDNSIDIARWSETDSGNNITETNQCIEGKGNGIWNQNGIVSNNAVELVTNRTWAFKVSPQHSSINLGMWGPNSSSSLSIAGTMCMLWFGYSPGVITVYINGNTIATGYSYQANKTYYCRIVYKNPGWEVYLISPDDTNFSTETLIYSTTIDSTGSMYFQANYQSPAGLTYLDNVMVYDIQSPVDRLLIPSGHNLAVESLSVMCSGNGTVYDNLEQWTGAAGLINKSWTANSARYWKFIVMNPMVVPELAEMFLTSTYEWERNPARPTGSFDNIFNVEFDQTASGQERFLVHGNKKRQKVYHLPNCGESQKDNIVTLNDAWAGSKPFWLEDHDGNWIYGRLRSPLNLKEVAYQSYSFDFDFLEILP